MTHGKYGTYRKGCRCAECRAANAAYHRGYRARHPEHRAYHAFMMRVYRRQAAAA